MVIKLKSEAPKFRLSVLQEGLLIDSRNVLKKLVPQSE